MLANRLSIRVFLLLVEVTSSIARLPNTCSSALTVAWIGTDQEGGLLLREKHWLVRDEVATRRYSLQEVPLGQWML